MSLSRFVLPCLLVLFGPLDLLIGLLHGDYPTEATLISLVSLGIGIVLFRHNWGKPNADVFTSSSDTDNAVLAAATARLNLRLGTGLLIFGVALNLLFIINGLIGPHQNFDSQAGNIVETGFILMFNLLVAGLEIFAARIYTAGSR